jgi:hypothetical protein
MQLQEGPIEQSKYQYGQRNYTEFGLQRIRRKRDFLFGRNEINRDLTQ